jgi:chemotaxis protein MotA
MAGMRGLGECPGGKVLPEAANCRRWLNCHGNCRSWAGNEDFCPMNIPALFDPASAAIVIGGTALATYLRCGTRNCLLAARALVQLGSPRFNAQSAKAELAAQVNEINQEGLLCAEPHHFGDSEFDEATDALIGRRSVAALLSAHERHKAVRTRMASRASSTLAQAAELAPVFGLAGTLISLSQLPADGIARGAYTSAIGMAVLTTLYGLLLANLLLAPLARAIDRAASAEEQQRQDIVDWLASQVAGAIPGRRAAAAQHRSMDHAA